MPEQRMLDPDPLREGLPISSLPTSTEEQRSCDYYIYLFIINLINSHLQYGMMKSLMKNLINSIEYSQRNKIIIVYIEHQKENCSLDILYNQDGDWYLFTGDLDLITSGFEFTLLRLFICLQVLQVELLELQDLGDNLGESLFTSFTSATQLCFTGALIIILGLALFTTFLLLTWLIAFSFAC